MVPESGATARQLHLISVSWLRVLSAHILAGSLTYGISGSLRATAILIAVVSCLTLIGNWRD